MTRPQTPNGTGPLIGMAGIVTAIGAVLALAGDKLGGKTLGVVLIIGITGLVIIAGFWWRAWRNGKKTQIDESSQD